MYLAKKMTLLSFPKIGWHIGHRDHSTVLYAVSKIKMLIASDAELAARVALIQTKIEEAVAEATRAVPVQTARPMSPRGEHHGG